MCSFSNIVLRAFGKVGENDAVRGTAVPRLPLLWSWLHACLSIQSDFSHLVLVINGEKVLEKVFPSQNQRNLKPTSLSGKLLLGKTQIDPNIWLQNRMLVTNLNVYSTRLSVDEMKMITFGEDCGLAEGDILAWESSGWRLEGAASWISVGKEELCEKEETILFFDQNLWRMSDCQQLCPKLHEKGQMPSIQTEEMLETVVFEMKKNFIDIIWAPVTRSPNGSKWVDIYSGEQIPDFVFWPGFPDKNSKAKCAILNDRVKNWECQISGGRGGRYCGCHFPVRPFLLLRGLCGNSHLDQLYLPRNEKVERTITYYGTVRTVASFNGTFWQMRTNFFKTSAFSDAPDVSFMLGKYNWTIEGDSVKCNKGKSYRKELKLTGCKDGQFTCDDGQCVKMKERCNQVPDCRDKSDEKGCQVIVFENNYNKNIPPIGRTVYGGSIPAQVNISITLMKVVEIEETDHSIHLQFRISMQWRENRVKYQNLKQKTSLNALTEDDIGKLWLPLIIYDNTDQKASTRLGWITEWLTRVSVIREGTFARSGLDEVDEAEIFEGDENTLMMSQTYTREFQCKYKLQQYPFDIQVNFQNHFR